MRDRQHDQQRIVGTDVYHRRRRLRVVDVIVVEPRDQLGHARGAARELEHGGIHRVDRDFAQCSRRYARLVCEAPCQGDGVLRRFAGHHDVAQRRALALDPPGQLDEIEVAGAVGDHVRDRLGQLDVILDLAVAVRRQRHDGNRAHPLEREVDVDELGNVGKLDDHAIERTNLQCEEVPSQPLDASGQLAVRDPLGSGDQSHSVGESREDILEHTGQRAIFPVALGSIACDEFRRERDDAVKRHRSREALQQRSACTGTTEQRPSA